MTTEIQSQIQHGHIMLPHTADGFIPSSDLYNQIKLVLQDIVRVATRPNEKDFKDKIVDIKIKIKNILDQDEEEQQRWSKL